MSKKNLNAPPRVDSFACALWPHKQHRRVERLTPDTMPAPQPPASVLAERLSSLILSGDTDRLAALLEAGGDANAEADGERLLHTAVREGSADAMTALLVAGADPNARDDESGESALHLAAYDGFEEGMRLLLAHGGNATAPDGDGSSPLHLASSSQFASLAMLHMLLDAGASIDAVDHNGRTCAHLAAERGRIDVLEVCASHSLALIVRGDATGALPLHVAAGSHAPKAIDSLRWLTSPARVEALDNQFSVDVRDQSVRCFAPRPPLRCYTRKRLACTRIRAPLVVFPACLPRPSVPFPPSLLRTRLTPPAPSAPPPTDLPTRAAGRNAALACRARQPQGERGAAHGGGGRRRRLRRRGPVAAGARRRTRKGWRRQVPPRRRRGAPCCPVLPRAARPPARLGCEAVALPSRGGRRTTSTRIPPHALQQRRRAGAAAPSSPRPVLVRRTSNPTDPLAPPLTAGASPHASGAGGKSALSHAAAAGSAACVKLLLNAGAPAAQRDEHGLTPLMHAANAGANGVAAVRALAAEEQSLFLTDNAVRFHSFSCSAAASTCMRSTCMHPPPPPLPSLHCSLHRVRPLPAL